MHTEDGELVSKCLSEDTVEFCLPVDKCKVEVYALAHSYLSNFYDAEDIAQKAFIEAYQNCT